MKSRYYIIIILLILCTYNCEQKSNHEQVNTFYQGYINSDYNQIKSVLSDSFITINGDFLTKYTPKTYYKLFQWDSVFKPTYKIINIENHKEHIIATVSVQSIRYQFLKNNPLTYKQKFYFKSGKISKIEDVGYIDTNWSLWEKQRDTLVSWVKLYHPKLDGFIYDLSKEGALNFLKAIELYQIENKFTE